MMRTLYLMDLTYKEFISGLCEPQFVQFNGGFSQEQLNWLNEVLTFSDTNQEKVVIVSKYLNDLCTLAF